MNELCNACTSHITHEWVVERMNELIYESNDACTYQLMQSWFVEHLNELMYELYNACMIRWTHNASMSHLTYACIVYSMHDSWNVWTGCGRHRLTHAWFVERINERIQASQARFVECLTYVRVITHAWFVKYMNELMYDSYNAYTHRKHESSQV